MKTRDAERSCIDCRHCELRVDFEKGSRRWCAWRGATLPFDAARERPCRRYEPIPPYPHYGP